MSTFPPRAVNSQSVRERFYDYLVTVVGYNKKSDLREKRKEDRGDDK